ncbi:pirin domain-containing protein [Thecamonas trahens ATCC 50062]|uniref:Pirin domain-containing protein n=1 Tax=Thecamonas trahens ATCC 50062 TaxID=461836 RepID=A0A0L0DG35_THETB|nr:pirin domain-containing protein [Thecamonas trahens ATCC 50062]KNC51076.1 pirin domain-containing protein [Thecamonas trahens ATCC 50062]|eukprot:XP_013756535.1 pirin domain-containing protein [Thecamonas trahens ATCC 50062]
MAQASAAAATLRGISQVIKAVPTSDGAGVRLMRTIGTRKLDSLDPFLLLDEFKSDDPSGYIAGFPDHPHRGFETVTYMLAGRMEHKDSVGNTGNLVPGSVQWMTAGSGIIHSEMPKMEEGLMWGFQLWCNLPAAQKMTPPRYQDIPPEDVPEVTSASGATVRIIAGEFEGSPGAVTGVATAPFYFDIALPEAEASVSVPVPEGHNAFVYVFDGEVSVDGTTVPCHALGVLDDGGAVEARAVGGPARFLLVGAKPIGEPVARHGPFVMNTDEEIMQAFIDFRNGELVQPQ